MSIRPILRGVISYIPILKKALPQKGTGGSSSSQYCYSVWMRHLRHLESCGLEKIPYAVGELEPGDSLGIGLAAILSGANKYYALDVIKHAETENNIRILHELHQLFIQNEHIPDGSDFEFVNPKVDSVLLPSLLTYTGSDKNLSASRLIEINNATIEYKINSNISISYLVPWDDSKIIKYNTLDLIFSQAVMEHVSDIESAYAKMYDWLKPGGLISHQIDFKAHETHDKWYGHHSYSKILWRIIMHGRKYDINRLPLSHHTKTILKSGFEILKVVPVFSERMPDCIVNRKYSDKFSEEDKNISSALIIARKVF